MKGKLRKNKTSAASKRGAAGGARNKASYDAVASQTRRRPMVTNLSAEDRVLRPVERDKMISDTRSLRRNAAIVAWALRKHLDYVSTFSFQCRTGNPDLDDKIESLVEWWARPLNCDVTGRFSLQKIIRLTEGLATTEGDCFVQKLNDGRVQIIEGDRVRTPNDLGEFKGNVDTSKLVHGVEVMGPGRPTRYAVCDREGGGFKLKALVAARFAFHHGYFDRYDQIRGVSPLSSAINTFCDVYESTEYALAKMKLSQLFALKLKRSGESAAGSDGDEGTGAYKFDFGAGPQVLDLDPNDDAEFMSSETPSSEFQQFMQTGIQIGLKALDIPYSFFAENYTNYSGARQALLQYEQSAANKRQAIKQLLTNLTLWRLSLFILDGQLVLPAGTTISDINFDWVAIGLPWIDPLKEAKGNEVLIANKLASRQQLCKAQGKDFFEIVDQLAEEESYMKTKGLNPTVAPPEPLPPEDPEEPLPKS